MRVPARDPGQNITTQGKAGKKPTAKDEKDELPSPPAINPPRAPRQSSVNQKRHPFSADLEEHDEGQIK